MEQLISELEDALLSLNRVKVDKILRSNENFETFMETLEHLLVPAMESIGTKWDKGDVALSQVYMSGKICEQIVDKIIPETKTKRKDDPNIALAVFQDHHLLGKMIVQTFLRASGYFIHDYGHQNNIDTLIEKIKTDKIEILLVSVLMFNSALHLKELMQKTKEQNIQVKVIVGGAPFRFDGELYQKIGADAMARDASDILNIIDELKDRS